MGKCISKPCAHHSQVSSSSPSEQYPEGDEESFSFEQRIVVALSEEVSAPLALPESSDIENSQSIDTASSLTPARFIENLAIASYESDFYSTACAAKDNSSSASSSSQTKSTPSSLSDLYIDGVLVEISKDTSKQGRMEVKDRNSPNGVEHSEIDLLKTIALEKTKIEWEKEKEKKKNHESDSN